MARTYNTPQFPLPIVHFGDSSLTFHLMKTNHLWTLYQGEVINHKKLEFVCVEVSKGYHL